MFKLSVALRVALGMALLSSTVLLLSASVGVGPDLNAEAMKHRSSLCETVAISSSLLASKGDFKGIEANLRGVVERNPDLLSAGVRRDDGALLVTVGDHEMLWNPTSQDISTDSHMIVPVLAGNKKWGSVELRFQALAAWTPDNWWQMPLTQQAIFITAVSGLVFFFYLRKMFKHLDPSRVVPPRVRSALDTMVSGLVIMDDQERIVLANRSFANSVGVDADKLVGFHAGDLPWGKADTCTATTNYPWSRALISGKPRIGDLMELTSADDEVRSYMVNSAPIAGDDGKNRGVLTSFEDVTQLERAKVELRRMLDELRTSRDEVKKKNEELTFLATRDSLTGCLNRRAFFETFETLWESSQRYKWPMSCVMVDVDHFKSINDKHGHSTGDQVLQKVAHTLRATARQCDLVCRYGGEEFCILLPQVDLDNGAQAAERFRLAIKALEFPNLSVTASLGVSALSLKPNDPQDMIDQADKCLYVAKRNGRNQVVRWDKVPKDTVIDNSKVSREKPEPGKAAATDAKTADANAEPGKTAEQRNEPSLLEIDSHSIPFGVVSTLLAALAYRDSATAEHSRRVADLCVLAASQILAVREVYTLEVAALMHDIGKIGVPDAILLKPGALTPEEWKVMGMHDRIGSDIIGATFSSPALLEIIENHHAFFGGRGRHEHLPTGRDIPIGARILSIADAYDAMVSDRVYRKGRPQEDAFMELRRCAGAQFDPDLVELFIEAVRSRDESRRTSVGAVSKQAAIQIGSQIERLADALDNRDCERIAALSNRLESVARKQCVPTIADAAKELTTIAEKSDLAEAVRLTIELLDLCRSIQDVVLTVSHDNAREAAVAMDFGAANQGTTSNQVVDLAERREPTGAA